MKIFPILTILLVSQFVFAQNENEQDTCCLSKFHSQNFEEVDLKELCNEYRRLVAQTSLCCEVWDSNLHQIMEWLGTHFGKEGTPINQIIRYMGMPDGTENELENASISLDDDEKALVYFWRGYHDFLYFVYENDKVKRAEWFMWGE